MLSLCNIKMLAVRLYNEHSYVRLLLMASKKKEEGVGNLLVAGRVKEGERELV